METLKSPSDCWSAVSVLRRLGASSVPTVGTKTTFNLYKLKWLNCVLEWIIPAVKCLQSPSSFFSVTRNWDLNRQTVSGVEGGPVVDLVIQGFDFDWGHELRISGIIYPHLPPGVFLIWVWGSTGPAVCPESGPSPRPPLLSPGSSLGGPPADSCPPRNSPSPPQTPRTSTSPRTAADPAAPTCPPCVGPPAPGDASPPEEEITAECSELSATWKQTCSTCVLVALKTITIKSECVELHFSGLIVRERKHKAETQSSSSI